MNEKITFMMVSLCLMVIMSMAETQEAQLKFESSYTSIAEKDCRTLDSDDLGSIQECESFADLKVKVMEGDIRQSITLSRGNQEYDLNFWSTVTQNFSSLGSQIEWRYRVGEPNAPIGIIVRLEANEDEVDMNKTTSYLVVSKITADEMCVVGKIEPKENQNEVARTMVDSSSKMPCLKRLKTAVPLEEEK